MEKFAKYQVNFLLAEVKQDEADTKIPKDLADRVNAFAQAGGLQAVYGDLKNLDALCSTAEQKAAECDSFVKAEEVNDK